MEQKKKTLEKQSPMQQPISQQLVEKSLPLSLVNDDGKTGVAEPADIETLLAGRAVRQHSDNKIDPRAILMLAFIIFLGFLLVRQVGVITAPKPTKTPTAGPATATPPVGVDGAKLMLTMQSLVGGQGTAVAGNVPVFLTAVSQLQKPAPVVQVMPTNTATAAPTATQTPFRSQTFVAIKTAWPLGAKSITGLDVTGPDSLGAWAACPDVWPLGTLLVREHGDPLLCVDRGNLKCNGAVCNIVVFSKSPLTALLPVQVIVGNSAVTPMPVGAK